MSVWEYLRNKKIWIAVGFSVVLLLALWAVGAALIEKGVLPVKMQPGWVAGTSLCAGFLGGCMTCEKKSGTLVGALVLSALLIIVEIIASWVLYGGVSFGGGAWKNVVMLFVGSLLAGLLCAGRRGGGKRTGKKTPKPRLPKRR